MPIGKNAIKRVINNGYSNVKSEAPDMENSEVREEKKPVPKKAASKNPAPKAATSKTKTTSSRTNPVPKAVVQLEPQKPAVKKSDKKTPELIENAAEKTVKPSEPVKEKEGAVTSPKKSLETEPELAPVKTLEKVAPENERSGEGYINLGGALPYYLL